MKKLVGLAVLAALLSIVAYVGPWSVMAQARRGRAAAEVMPTTFIRVEAAEIRTAEDIERDEAALGPAPPRPLVVPFRPTMALGEYQRAKAWAAARRGVARPSAGLPRSLAPPILKARNFDGVGEGTSCSPLSVCAPPDTHGAVGKSHFVEVTNTRISMFAKDGTLVNSISLNGFFGVPLSTPTLDSSPYVLFDPRAVYDATWNRWVILADAPNELSGLQRLFIAVSKTGDPTGAFFKYNLPLTNFPEFFDYPQLGMDQDAVILTGNIFDLNTLSFLTARMFAVAKARLYNGLSATGVLVTGLAGTLAPPIVLDQNASTFLIAAQVNNNTLQLYSAQNLSQPDGATLTLQANVPVTAYTVPPNAAQPGTASTLDTLDNRFVNASTQIGNSLWNVHTVDGGGFPTPRFYEINTSSNTVIQSGDFFASGTSHDWNASIAVNTLGEAFVTWSSTDPTIAINARVMFSGRQAADAAGSMNAAPGGTVLFTSPTFYNDFTCSPCRWGDYSAVSLDPQSYSPISGPCDAGKRAWIVNEKINNNTRWGSRIGRIGFC